MATSLSKPQLDAWLRPHFPDSLDLLSELDTKRYRLQRRLIGRTYHASNVARYEAAIDSVLERATAKLASLRGREVDLTEWMHIIAVECLGACVLSWSPGLLSDGTDGGTIAHSYHGWRKKSVFGLFPAMTKLELLSPGAGRVFSALFGVTYRTPANFKTFFPVRLRRRPAWRGRRADRVQHVAKRVSRRIKAALRPDPAKDDRTDLLADLIQLHKDKPAFSETYLKKMAVTNFGAGHETMASTLTSVLAMLATHPESQRRAVAEARAAPGPTAYADAASTPFTRAAIKEAMRLHPVIAMSLPRRAPPGGLQVQQHWIPAGTTVGCSPVALHRNRAVFGADAERFDPRRWLDAGARRAMDRYNLCWGGGSRSCPGRSLAELVVFKAVAALLARFDVQVVAMPRDEEQRSYFLSVMTGVTVRFLAVGE